MRRGMWAMITLLEVFDCNFSDSLVQRFSAPGGKTNGEYFRQLFQSRLEWTKGSRSHPVPQSQPTPWGPRRQRWPGSAASAGSARSEDTPHREESSAALIGCCWTAPEQSHELPSHSASEGLEHQKHVGHGLVLGSLQEHKNSEQFKVQAIWCMSTPAHGVPPATHQQGVPKLVAR